MLLLGARPKNISEDRSTDTKEYLHVREDEHLQDTSPAVKRLKNATKQRVYADSVVRRSLIGRKAWGWYLGRACCSQCLSRASVATWHR